MMKSKQKTGHTPEEKVWACEMALNSVRQATLDLDDARRYCISGSNKEPQDGKPLLNGYNEQFRLAVLHLGKLEEKFADMLDELRKVKTCQE